ncbi:MAG: acetolactate synthase small subunit [Gemmatimonadetes bacterium]|nr:acetolactate synthase small subunit [Gemmatimonadota bacterium]
MRHILSILIQNESGALSRVASMFASRGFNIESLSVAPTDDETVSRLTLVTIGTEDMIGQVSKQLAKLIDVVAVADRTSTDHIARELGLLKFAVPPNAAGAFRSLVENYGAEVLDDHLSHFTIEVTGTEKQVDALLGALPEGVRLLSIVRSGPLVISRGPQALA